MHFFTPYHVKLLSSCYPPSSVIPTAGPDYFPNAHELSRLTYYASNHPGKLTKIASELEKRVKNECYKARAGNIRSRASLLISLAIFRSLVTECRRDIALLSSSLIGSIDCTLASVPSDLEVVARAASVFTAWTTYTNGQLIGADSSLTNNYLSILSQFANLSSTRLSDQETQNRTRLIGMAALIATVNSEALHNTIGHFGTQASTILRPILIILFDTPTPVLEEQSSLVRDAPDSPYLADFRTRPAFERRAASIHVHTDGDKGPSASDVSEACLRALYCLLGHANGAQLGYVMQSSFDNLDLIQGWSKIGHCCWYAQKAAEWAQYQYRYVVPTWLVDRLSSQENTLDVPPLLESLVSMITSVFSSSTPLINLSSSDILSNLLSLLLRRISMFPEDCALPILVESISSLGRHVYYSDQIQDLTGELIGRLVVIEVQGISVKDQSKAMQSRSSAIQCILQAAVGLFRAAQASDSTGLLEGKGRRAGLDSNKTIKGSFDLPRREMGGDVRTSRRTRIPPDIWQDTLSLLCDSDPSVRRGCSNALIDYIKEEMPKFGESTDTDGKAHLRRLAGSSFRQVPYTFSRIGDAATRFLNATHAYTYILVTSTPLGPSESITRPTTGNADIQQSDDGVDNSASPADEDSNCRPCEPKTLKQILLSKLVAATSHAGNVQATEEDYASLLKILCVIQVQLPMRGLITGVPMLIALDAALKPDLGDLPLDPRLIAIKTVIWHVWSTIGQVWKILQLVTLAEQTITSLIDLPKADCLPSLQLKTGDAVNLLASSQNVQYALGLDHEGILRQFSMTWTPQLALRDFANSPGFESTLRADSTSPLLKISPALMRIENISLQSLARSTRGLGVTDLREALEGRSSMSNPNLVRPPSVSTLDHTSSVIACEVALRLTRTRSRSRIKNRSTPYATGDVRDVLARLGINKQNGNVVCKDNPDSTS